MIQDKATQTLVQSVQDMGTQTMMDEPQQPLDQDRDKTNVQFDPTVSTKQHGEKGKDVQGKPAVDGQVNGPDYVGHQTSRGMDPRQVPKDTEQPDGKLTVQISGTGS